MWVCSNRCPYTILGVEFVFTQELRLDNQSLKTPCVLCQGFKTKKNKKKEEKEKLSIWLFHSQVSTEQFLCRPHGCTCCGCLNALWQRELRLTPPKLSSLPPVPPCKTGSCSTVRYFWHSHCSAEPLIRFLLWIFFFLNSIFPTVQFQPSCCSKN